MLIKPIKQASSELGQGYSFILCTKTPSNTAHKEEVRGKKGRRQERGRGCGERGNDGKRWGDKTDRKAEDERY